MDLYIIAIVVMCIFLIFIGVQTAMIDKQEKTIERLKKQIKQADYDNARLLKRAEKAEVLANHYQPVKENKKWKRQE